MRTLNNVLTIKTYGYEVDEETGKLTLVEKTGRKQIVHNSPLGEYASDLDVVIIETHPAHRNLTAGNGWLERDEALELVDIDEAKLDGLVGAGVVGAKSIKGEERYNKNDLLHWHFEQPVEINGKAYFKNFAWSSAVKTGSTFGLREDFFARMGILRFKEDAYRIGRAYMPNCTSGLRGQFRVKLVPVGTFIPGIGKVDDGFGYMRRSLGNLMETNGLGFKKVESGKWGNSYSFIQRFSLTDELWSELKPHMDEGLREVSADNEEFALTLVGKGYEVGTKTEFAKVGDLAEHPYIASTLATTRAQHMFRVATTAGFPMDGALFVPTTSDNLVLPASERFSNDGKHIIIRYPIDGSGSIRVVDVERFGSEADRIRSMDVLQYTLTNHFDNSFKGLVGLVDDSAWVGEWAEYDMIVCVEDEKLNSGWLTADDVQKIEREYVFTDAVLSVTQWYAAGSAIGVPSKLAKDLNADYDGDTGAVICGTDYPELTRQADALPKLRNPKLPKTKTPTVPGENRTEKALLSMANIVGIATNIVSTVLGVVDQERTAAALGFKHADEMHEFFMLAIKLGTDIFKTSYDYRPVLSRLGQINTVLGNLGIKAPWTHWKNDDRAFRHQIPAVVPTDDLESGEFDEWEAANSILPACEAAGRQDAIVAQLLRYALPKMSMPDNVAIRPLAFYRDWAVATVHATMGQDIQTLVNLFADRVNKVNVGDPKSWNDFVTKWVGAVDFVIDRSDYDRYEFANNLWVKTHSEQRFSQLDKQAAAVFIGMPDEALQIATERPGLTNRVEDAVHNVVVTGLQYQLPDADEDGFVVPVQVVGFDDERGGTRIRRFALVAESPLLGQVQPRTEHYPANMIGLLALQHNLDAGKYDASFAFVPGKKRGGSWVATLKGGVA